MGEISIGKVGNKSRRETPPKERQVYSTCSCSKIMMCIPLSKRRRRCVYLSGSNILVIKMTINGLQNTLTHFHSFYITILRKFSFSSITSCNEYIIGVFPLPVKFLTCLFKVWRSTFSINKCFSRRGQSNSFGMESSRRLWV